MSAAEGYEIRLVCDMAAAHKDGKNQHIDSWLWDPETTRVTLLPRRNGRPPRTKVSEGHKQEMRQLDYDAVSFDPPTHKTYTMFCPRDRCKSQKIDVTEMALAAVFSELEELGEHDIALSELRDKVSAETQIRFTQRHFGGSLNRLAREQR